MFTADRRLPTPPFRLQRRDAVGRGNAARSSMARSRRLRSIYDEGCCWYHVTFPRYSPPSFDTHFQHENIRDASSAHNPTDTRTAAQKLFCRIDLLARSHMTNYQSKESI